jgi:hypothetical protein
VTFPVINDIIRGNAKKCLIIHLEGDFMIKTEAFNDFVVRFKHLITKNPHLIKTTLSNIFTMRLIGNKTHGDLAEIGISEFINQFMYDFSSVHVGKELYRAKEHEEDIKIINEISKVDFSISLKAYGDGPLQLSTDKNSAMFSFLKSFKKDIISDTNRIKAVFSSKEFSEFGSINVLPLVYDEKNEPPRRKQRGITRRAAGRLVT